MEVTWWSARDVDYFCLQERYDALPAGRSTPAAAGAVRHVAGSVGSPHITLFHPDVDITSLLLEHEIDTFTIPIVRRFLAWVLGAVALLKVSRRGANRWWLLLPNIACLLRATRSWRPRPSVSRVALLQSGSRLQAMLQPQGRSMSAATGLQNCRSPNTLFSNIPKSPGIIVWSHCHGPTRPFSASREPGASNFKVR